MKLELKWVSIIVIVHLLWNIGERFLGFFGEKAAYQGLSGSLFLVVYALLMYLAVADLRSRNRGFLNRRQGFLSGLFISLILVALSPIMVGILAFVIQPDFFNEMIMASTTNGEYQSYQMAEQEYNYWNYVKLYMAGYMLVGSLSAALWSFVLHKMPDPVTD
jgi:hypothetical protein